MRGGDRHGPYPAVIPGALLCLLVGLMVACGSDSTMAPDVPGDTGLFDTVSDIPVIQDEGFYPETDQDLADGLDGEEDRACFGKVYYRDKDNDKYGVHDDFIMVCPGEPVPEGYIVEKAGGWDCNDDDDEVHPLAPEVCDGKDNDCDTHMDNLPTTLCTEENEHGTCSGKASCTGQELICYADIPAPETCDNVDNDCDGDTDEGLTLEQECGVSDEGECTLGLEKMVCGGGIYGEWHGCTATLPAEAETCNGKDDDCNGETDDGVLTVFFPDGDSDGYGDPGFPVSDCVKPPGYVLDGQDCNDTKPFIHPGMDEECNGVDDNCNGETDEGVLKTYYEDADEDGFGDPNAPKDACAKPVGYLLDQADCDDTDVGIHPGAKETCDEVDEDCDGDTDESIPLKGQPCDGSDVDSCPNGTFTCTANAEGLECVNETVDACLDRECGTDYCGGDCGVCDDFPNSFCNAWKCDCKPLSCGTLGHDCGGPWDNGCGEPIPSCGACDEFANSQCNDGACECEPETCQTLGYGCGGPYNDLCGGWTAYCGACANGYECSGSTHQCHCPSGVECGDACCPAGQTCSQGVCSGGDFDPEGTYVLAPQVAFSCAFGAVDFIHGTLTFSDNGTSLVVMPWMNGCCQMTGDSAQDGTFTVTCTCPGGGICTEIYTLSGTFTNDTTWEGSLDVLFSGALCLDCTYKVWNLTATKL